MVARSDSIVAGQCVDIRTEWLDRKVYTIATIQVGEVAKGTAAKGGSIEVYLLGGRVKKPIPIKMHVPGEATIKKGEEAVLFLESGGSRKQLYRLVGMMQGKVPIANDPKTGMKIIVRQPAIKEVRIVDPDGDKSVMDRDQDLDRDRDLSGSCSLEGFLGRIQQIVHEQKDEAVKQKGGAK